MEHNGEALHSGFPAYPLIVLVHSDPEFSLAFATALQGHGYRTQTFVDPLAAWDICRGSRMALLVTQVEFPPGRSNGISLALMTRSKHSGARVLFIGLPEHVADTNGIGNFVTIPVDIQATVDLIARLLHSP
jgi:DNA-binding NtrC family response regulator